MVGGDKLPYEVDVGSPASNLIEKKLVNSTISDAHKDAKFLSCDLKDFFLASPMTHPEYISVSINHFPQDIKEKYNLHNLMDAKGQVFVKIKKGMYGLKQAAILAYEQLSERLQAAGYRPIITSTGMWKHETRQIILCLCLDDFEVKYFSDSDAKHLLQTLGKYYQYTVDWSGRNFCGLTFDWNYKEGYVDISMPGYISDTLKNLQHEKKPKPQCSPH